MRKLRFKKVATENMYAIEKYETFKKNYVILFIF